MVQGDAYNIDISITNNGEALEINDIETVEVSLLYLQKK